MAGIALKGQCDLVSIMVPQKVSKKKSFRRRNEDLEDVKNIANLYLCGLAKYRAKYRCKITSVREGVWCQLYTDTSSSSLCMFLKKFSLILCFNFFMLVDFKSDARLFHIFGPW